MNLESIGTQLLYTTVPLLVETGNGTSAGTGFIYTIPVSGTDKNVPLLVTCKHVVHGAKRGLMQFARGQNGAPLQGETLRVEFDASYFSTFQASEHDLVAAPIAGIINELQAGGGELFFRSISPDIVPTSEVTGELAAIEDVTIIGYPSGIFDQKNATPLVRKGITATPIWNDFNGAPIFLIDAGIYPGSSGSPVFVLNQGAYATKGGLTIGSRILFVGMITETYFGEAQGGNRVYLNLGKVLNSRALTQYFSGLEKQFPK